MFRKIIGGFLKKHEWLRKYARKMNQKVRSRQYLRLAEKIEVEPKTILFESYMGRQYACSPRAIYEAMLQDSRFSDYQLDVYKRQCIYRARYDFVLRLSWNAGLVYRFHR